MANIGTTLICAVCASKLNVKMRYIEYKEEFEFSVEPCEQCLEEGREEGLEEGREEGRAEATTNE